jgi:hypothetical protein
MHLYHPKISKTAPVPSTKEELQVMRTRGYFLARELVDTVNGHRVHISCEPSVNSGCGPEQALELVRKDAGHESEPAFMTTEQWEALPKDEKRRRIVGSIAPGLAPALPDRTEVIMSEAQSERDRLTKENEELRRQLDDLTAPRGNA